MTTEINQIHIDRDLAVGQKIWGALLASLFIYLMVALEKEIEPRPDSWNNIFVQVLMILSTAILFGTFLCRRAFLRRGPRPPSTSDPEEACLYALKRYRLIMIASLAMLETIGLYGLIIYLIIGNKTALFLLIAVAALGQICIRPTRQGLLDYVGLLEDNQADFGGGRN